MTNDAAPNRAIKYFSGGYGATGSCDWFWNKKDPISGKRMGINLAYKNGDKNTAYYFLGHASHLVQDVALPAHALNDPHLIGFGTLLDDPDPLHDYVDSFGYSTTGTATGARAIKAGFDDLSYTPSSTPKRYENWIFDATQNGVGRQGKNSSFLKASLRSAQDFKTLYDNNKLSPETYKSIPAKIRKEILPMYLLFCETAVVGGSYDSKDANGKLDKGQRRVNGKYSDWSKAKLDEVADVIMPRAMVSTAELFRYFYSQVDTTAPEVALNNLSNSCKTPTLIQLQQGQTLAEVSLNATANDATSGVEQKGFRYSYSRWTNNNWQPLPVVTDGNQTNLKLGAGLYRMSVNVDNGAGLTGQSTNGFVCIHDADTPASQVKIPDQAVKKSNVKTKPQAK